jgi:hypothetical protein
LAVRLGSDGLEPPPAPRLPIAGPRLSAARARSARAAPPVSRSRLRALARLPADLIPSVVPRSNGQRSPIPLRPHKLHKETPGFLEINPPSLEFRS